MTLDDRSLHEHLDRRASGGASDPERLADAIVASLPAGAAGVPGWRRRVLGGLPALGFAAAAVIVAIVAVAVLPQRLWPPSGASPSPSAAAGYPLNRPLTTAELARVVAEDSTDLAGTILVADTSMIVPRVSCTIDAPCPVRFIPFDEDGHGIFVWADGATTSIGPSPFAFRIRAGGGLDLLGSVATGPDGLAWLMPSLLDTVTASRSADPATPSLYLVDARRVVSRAAYRCPADPSPPEHDFGCGSAAWLIEPAAIAPAEILAAPRDSLRVPNVPILPAMVGADRERAFWLVDPRVPQEDCFLCPPAGAADLLGRVLPLAELGLPQPTP
ncbi:MAG: hypothetical protein HYX57_08685 [Chloroflexi bacterium]|nr:hypothetical protein [Chloroflexota bacterium]